MGLFNKLIYGNPNKPDLVVADNQKPIQLFFEILKIKLWELIKLNLLFALFFLPTAFWVQFNYRILINALSNISEEILTLETLASSNIFAYLFIFFVGMIPCLMILGIALPGFNYIIKSYAKEFHVWMIQDFFEKLKENWKQSLLYTFILGVMFLIFYIATTTYTLSLNQIPGAFIFRSILYIIAAILLLSTIYVYPLMITFELKMKNIIKNSILLTIGKLPQTLLVALSVLVIPIFLLWLASFWSYGFFAFLIYYLVIGFSLSAFIINSYTNHVFKEIKVASGDNQTHMKPELERKEK